MVNFIMELCVMKSLMVMDSFSWTKSSYAMEHSLTDAWMDMGEFTKAQTSY